MIILIKKSFFAAILCSVLLFLLSTGKIEAATVTIEVDADNPSCSSTANPPCFTSIQPAIDQAETLASTNTNTTFAVMVEPSKNPYAGGLELKSGINVQGRETARTIINGGSTGTAVTANAVTGSVVFSNFTIITATMGIHITGNSTVRVMNNVFNVGLTGTGLQEEASLNTTVINNTFYQNGTALARDSDIQVTNNIFSNNTTDISQTISAQANITFNCFNPTPGPNSPVGSSSIPGTTGINPDPLFVKPSIRDFHLKDGSPCIGAGTNVNGPNSFDGKTSDIGAYGGGGSDKSPFPVQNVNAAAAGTDSITVSWSSNDSYLITNNTGSLGSYNVYFSLSGGTQSKQTVLATSTTGSTLSTVLSGLTTSVSAPSVPTNLTSSPLDSALVLSWTASSGATGYKVHYGITSVTENSIDIGNPGASNGIVSYKLGNLVNGQTYLIAVSAYASSTYNIAVTAVDNQGDESAQSAAPQPVSLGATAESALSDPPIKDFPEAIVPFPNLPNKGCFIATAAYGYYSAPQVQALRLFRDRYLMPTSVGRAFVAWYYRYGPIGAAFMETHPWLKPLVRVALLPAVGGALFLTGTSLIVKMMFLACFVVVTTFILRRKILARSGGTR